MITDKKIFICDDDLDIVEMMAVILEDSEAQIFTVTDSLELFPQLLKEKPDLLILDLWMPVLSGDQILKSIRASDSLKELRVIVSSASKDGREVAELAGADAYIEKPFDISELLSTVDKFIHDNTEHNLTA